MASLAGRSPSCRHPAPRALLGTAAAAVALVAVAVHPTWAVPLGGGGSLSATVRQNLRTDLGRPFTLLSAVSPAASQPPPPGFPPGFGIPRPSCPPSLAFRAADSTADGGLSVPFANLTEGGATCEGDGAVAFGPRGGPVGAPAAHPALTALLDAGAVAPARLSTGAYSEGTRVCRAGTSSTSTSGSVTRVAVAADVSAVAGLAVPGAAGPLSFPGGGLLLRWAPGGPRGGGFPPVCVYHGATASTAVPPGGGGDAGAGGTVPGSVSPLPLPQPTSDGGVVTAGRANVDCFPAASTVETAGGAIVRLADVPVGASVRVAPGVGAAAFSPIYLFTHKLPAGDYPYVRAVTASGAALTASPGHLVYASGRRVPAASLAVGHVLPLAPSGAAGRNATVATAAAAAADAAAGVVVAVERVTARGRVHPHTLAGDIVVDGVLASGWTTAVPPAVGAALLAPARAAWALGGRDVTGGVLEGRSPWVERLRGAVGWLAVAGGTGGGEL